MPPPRAAAADITRQEVLAAILKNDFNTVVRYIKQGGDVLIQSDDLRRRSLPALVAQQQGPIQLVQWLLLQQAKRGYFLEIFAYLEAGGEKNIATTSEEKTLLHFAAAEKNRATIILLLTKGANREHRDKHGREAISYAATEDKKLFQMTAEQLEIEWNAIQQACAFSRKRSDVYRSLISQAGNVTRAFNEVTAEDRELNIPPPAETSASATPPERILSTDRAHLIGTPTGNILRMLSQDALQLPDLPRGQLVVSADLKRPASCPPLSLLLKSRQGPALKRADAIRRPKSADTAPTSPLHRSNAIRRPNASSPVQRGLARPVARRPEAAGDAPPNPLFFKQ